MKCESCGNWLLSRKTVYEDGTEIATYTAPEGKGHCKVLDIDTVAFFGCFSFEAGEHVEVTAKVGLPWQHFTMIPCPACSGAPGDAGMHCQCAGTGLVRRYDDRYIGEERTRKHPKEVELEKAVASTKRRAELEALLAGMEPPAEVREIDGTVLQPMSPASVI